MSSWLPRAPSDTEDTLIGTFASMCGTTGAQLLLVGYSALTADEQDDAFALICDARLSRQAEGDSELALMVRSLRRAAEDTGAGAALTVDEYPQAARDLKASDDPIEPLSRVLRFFDDPSGLD